MSGPQHSQPGHTMQPNQPPYGNPAASQPPYPQGQQAAMPSQPQPGVPQSQSQPGVPPQQPIQFGYNNQPGMGYSQQQPGYGAPNPSNTNGAGTASMIIGLFCLLLVVVRILAWTVIYTDPDWYMGEAYENWSDLLQALWWFVGLPALLSLILGIVALSKRDRPKASAGIGFGISLTILLQVTFSFSKMLS